MHKYTDITKMIPLTHPSPEGLVILNSYSLGTIEMNNFNYFLFFILISVVH